jgi:iron complex outermembrane receptor protein
LFIKNLFDEHYVGSLRRISGSVGGAGAVAQSIPRDFDRYFGVTLSAMFCCCQLSARSGPGSSAAWWAE